MNTNPEKKIKELNNKLLEFSKEYYDNDSPSISDEQYDAMYSDYFDLIKEFPEFEPKNSVAKKVGGSVSSKFSKVDHQYKMLSLGNAFNEEDLIKFDKHINDQLGVQKDIEYICEYKIDGLSVSIIYQDGKFFKAITRGDGATGEDVTENVNMIKSIPKTINYKNKLEVRGEIYISNKEFEKINKLENGKYANARNLASGTLRQLDKKIVGSRNLSIFLYNIPNPLDHNLNTQREVLDFLDSHKFPINNETTVVKNINEAYLKSQDFTNRRNDLEYEVDGAVTKVNNIKLYEDIGYTAKYPKFMIAYKFPAEIVFTELLGIFTTIGRTGRVTYNAKLAPVKLAGSTVSAATLHNADYVIERNVNVGDLVNVKKAGDIIPRVLGVKEKRNNEQWVKHTTCDSCKNEFTTIEGEVDQYCRNQECPEIKLAFFENFVSKYGMNIEGLSTEIIRLMIKEELIIDISSIFDLPNKKAIIMELPSFKEKATDNLIKSIKKSLDVPFDKFIYSLGIRHIGRKNSAVVAKRFGTLDNLLKSTSEEINKIRSLGTKVAQSLRKYFDNETNIHIIKQCKDKGLNIQQYETPISNILENLTFVITGTLSKPRDHFKKIIESFNGNVSGSVSRNTSYVLAGEEAGSKLAKAEKLNINVLDEKKFEELIKEKQNG